ncbi:hypothetical protein DSO57_1025424 [Entomophthora muscae]|uniref:Uncharacterized protein n=1 Tax=Entomophthora muscae TaxID=34485 RepID=A0ACC2U132_9FUNG|nr:hypothetical protein DSO57_1025424 [Entomophthora muscae]
MAPAGQILQHLATCLEETGTRQVLFKAGRPQSSCSAKNIAAAAQDVKEEPGKCHETGPCGH